jgi:hypothetical protein
MSADFLFVAVFLASTVEAIEALTIVLAVGLTREWSASFWIAAFLRSFVDDRRNGEFDLPLTLLLWGRLTARRVTHEELYRRCRHDGTGRLCAGCTFVIENGVRCVADFAA